MKVLFYLGLFSGGLLCSADPQTLQSDASLSPLRAIVHLRGPVPVSSPIDPNAADGSYLESDTDVASKTPPAEAEDAVDQPTVVSALQLTQDGTPDTRATGVAGPEQCSCEFAGNCLPKGSCLALAFTLVAVTLVFVIFLAWLLQWIIAIPSEYAFAFGRKKNWFRCWR
ncbi:conserved hypothetical protein [Neospora caninum Liverpool]|uniref:Transmembrane protein n=1 Tax=Neospora caninum (strain Liverpool) TaxID=572307 RepID=F0VIT4_NEOCL|nr:conserved hypothetical protein [Neospora caninum Liverpool]CBZ53645.1 conserved hypothetical protein [Neospora caninum Liverpool]|eukprot:XP_003883677.1 conserved hypothetical protein [Neospora caninum Liverpool]